MADAFSNHIPGLTAPASKLAAVTPDDATDLAATARALWIGTGGNISIIAADDAAAVQLLNVPDGFLLCVRAKRVRATGTTASGIVALS